jgi:hypothetical protein
MKFMASVFTLISLGFNSCIFMAERFPLARIQFLSKLKAWHLLRFQSKQALYFCRMQLHFLTEHYRFISSNRAIAQFSDEVISHIDDTLDHVNEDLAILTDVVAQQFVSDEQIRQSLLENNNPTQRAETLIRHLRIQKTPM